MATLSKTIKNRIRQWLRQRLLDIIEPKAAPDPRKQIKVGRYSYGLNKECIPIYEPACHLLEIGSFCSIAPGVRFVFGTHQINTPSTFPMRELVQKDWNPSTWPKEKITIGNDVWIASNVLILPNVTIGHGSVIAAGSVVTKDVAPYTVCAGVPAKPIRERLTPDQATKMLAIAWWDWPESKLLENIELFYGDIDLFINKHS